MATIRYFAECNGTVVQLDLVRHDGAVATTAEHFSGFCPLCRQMHVCTRKIERKSFPSLHKCDARCQNARGHSCECACGGKNHGRAA